MNEYKPTITEIYLYTAHRSCTCNFCYGCFACLMFNPYMGICVHIRKTEISEIRILVYIHIEIIKE